MQKQIGLCFELIGRIISSPYSSRPWGPLGLHWLMSKWSVFIQCFLTTVGYAVIILHTHTRVLLLSVAHSVFWDLYCAAPERRDTCEHSSEAKAFHDYVSLLHYFTDNTFQWLVYNYIISGCMRLGYSYIEGYYRSCCRLTYLYQYIYEKCLSLSIYL